MTKRLPRTVNKEQLAVELNIAPLTLNRWIKKYSDFPIVQVGEGKGTPWLFDPDAVKAWQKANNKNAMEKHKSEIAANNNPDYRKKLAQAEQEEIKLAQMKGELLKKDEVRATLNRVFIALAKSFDEIPQKLKNEYRQKEEVCRVVAAYLDVARDEFVDALKRDLINHPM